MARVSLGGGDADFGAGVDVETAIGGAGNRRTDYVDDPDAQRPLTLRVLESAQSIRGFTGLRDENNGIIAEERALTI